MFDALIGGALGFLGASEQASTSRDIANMQMGFNAEQSQLQRDWATKEASTARDFSKEMSSSAVQRRMEDLKKAGINPILAGKYDASTPAASTLSGSAASYSSTPSIPNKMASAMQASKVFNELKLLKENVRLTSNQADKTESQADIFDVTAEFAKVLERSIEAISGKGEGTGFRDIPHNIKRAVEDHKKGSKIRNKDRIEVTPYVKSKTNKTKDYFTGGRYK